MNDKWSKKVVSMQFSVVELNALLKALHSAKFSSNPLHREVAGSPYIVSVMNRLYDTLDKISKEDLGFSPLKRPNFGTIGPESKYWKVIEARIIEIGSWWLEKATLEDKQRTLENLAFPYRIDSKRAHEYISILDHKCSS